ncbi:unnamed protein product [Linum tenue]|uniref:Major facilitator superfamily (MFS) profile domain-containing protein n=1 Tax=Linum tenue TaxID=586396 RepID=A0AAV0KQ01_9ROSI|nr:unnamed protein product [Linum tenue]
MAANSLAPSYSPNSSCFLRSRPNLIPLPGRTSINLRLRRPIPSIKWENTTITGHDVAERQRGGGRRRWSVRCAAEGMERGMLMGGREAAAGEIAGALSTVPERYTVVALTALVMCLCNADRVVMSVAVVPLAAKFGWSSSFLGIVQSSFLWGYIFSSLIGGALVDKYGGKKVLAWGVALWSLATVLTPLAANHSTLSLLAVRAFFGLAEGVALPSMTTLLSRELKLIQAGKTNSSADSSSSSSSQRPSLGQLLSKLPSWAIILANVTNNWGYFVLLSWMPVYFKTVFNVNLQQAAWFSAVPWGTMAFSGYLAGAASDRLIKVGYSVTLVRKIMQSIGFIGPGLALLCLNYANTPTTASVFITAALSLSSFSQAGFLLNIQDIAPGCAGFLHGMCNSAGTLAAIVSTIGTGYFVQWLGSFQAFLTSFAVAVHLLGDGDDGWTGKRKDGGGGARRRDEEGIWAVARKGSRRVRRDEEVSAWRREMKEGAGREATRKGEGRRPLGLGLG